ncbi:MAG: hypothetical protein WCX82_01740, partial [archaeon]
MIKKKAIEPLIATILLVIVSVIIITVILSFGKDFSNRSLSKANNLIQEEDSEVSLFLDIKDGTNGAFLITYKPPATSKYQDINIIGYSILELNTIEVPLEIPLYLTPYSGDILKLSIMQKDFDLILYLDNGKQIVKKGVKQNIVSPIATDCPGGYIPVPGNYLYNTMYSKNGFCVMQYEAKADNDDDNVGDESEYYRTEGSSTPNSIFNFQEEGVSKIVSTPEGYPIGNITYTDAVEMCESQGENYSLINNEQYMTLLRNAEVVNENWSGGEIGNGQLWVGNVAMASYDIDNRSIYQNAGNTFTRKILDGENYNSNFLISDGVVNLPYDIAVDSNFAYIADTLNNRIIKVEKNNLENIVISSIGIISSNYELNAPKNIVLNNDKLYVSDTGNNRIVILDLNLNLITTFGSYGTENVQFNSPRGIDVDSSYIYVVDLGNQKVKIFNSTSQTLIHTIDTSEDHSFYGISGIAVDNEKIYVSNSILNTIYVFNKSDFSYNTKEKINYKIYDISLDEDYIYGTDNIYNSVVLFNKSDLSYYISLNKAGEITLNSPSGICIDSEHIYVADTANNGIVRYDKENNKNFYKSINGYVIGTPRSVAISDNYIYVVDSSFHKLLKLDLNYNVIIEIGGISGSGDDQFNGPSGVSVDDTYVYIADTSNQRIVKRLKSDLSYVSKIGTGGSGNDQFNWPSGVSVDETYVYVADTYNHRIVKRLKSDLSYVSEIGSNGSGNDQFSYPSGVSVDDTYVYIADTGNQRIVKRLKSDLSYVSKTGTGGSGNDQFNWPSGVSVDDTYVYIADTSNQRIVKRLKSDLSYVSKIGTGGSGNDQFNGPFGVFVNDTYVYVADTGNHRIVRFNFPDNNYYNSEVLFSSPRSVAISDNFIY